MRTTALGSIARFRKRRCGWELEAPTPLWCSTHPSGLMATMSNKGQTRRYARTVSARMSRQVVERMQRAARSREERLSEFVRAAILDRLVALEGSQGTDCT